MSEDEEEEEALIEITLACLSTGLLTYLEYGSSYRRGVVVVVVVLWCNKQGFSMDFCDVVKSGDHSQNNLAKFGYILDMKVEKTK